MRGTRPLCAWVIGSVLLATPARSDDRQEWFDKGTQADLSGERNAARTAFSWFRRAAEVGLPEAEFNVAVMLDSGRGVEQDVAGAATWYARSAARGNARAAYNLGQLYEAGQGVPRNADLARAWFIASGLPAARERIAQLATGSGGHSPLTAPVPVAPAAGERVTRVDGGIELVWLAPAQVEPAAFTVEVRRLTSTSSDEVFAGRSDTSSVVARVPDIPGDYAWRVLAIAGKAGRYATGPWTVFQITTDGTPGDAANAPPVGNTR